MRYAQQMGLQVFIYPMGAILAPFRSLADAFAIEWGMDEKDASGKWTYNAQRQQVELALDSAEAKHRLGVFGDVEAQRKMERGD